MSRSEILQCSGLLPPVMCYRFRFAGKAAMAAFDRITYIYHGLKYFGRTVLAPLGTTTQHDDDGKQRAAVRDEFSDGKTLQMTTLVAGNDHRSRELRGGNSNDLLLGSVLV